MTQPSAIVSGCARGIGAAGVRELAQSGWKLALLDRDSAVQDLATQVGAVHCEVVDAGDPAALEAAVVAATQALGSIDAVWSNAGVQVSGGIDAVSAADWEVSWAVNVRAHALLSRLTLPALRTSRGSFLVTASNSGLLAESEMVAYSVTKAAAIALVRCLARDHATSGVRFNALCPGYVDTAFNGPIWSLVGGREQFLNQVGTTIPMGRMASAEEIGRLAVWLLTDERASYITGQAIVADGGETLV